MQTERFNLTANERDAEVLRQLQEYLGMTRSGAIRFVVRQAAQQYGILPSRDHVETASLVANRAPGELEVAAMPSPRQSQDPTP